jgi:hypothetical protein
MLKQVEPHLPTPDSADSLLRALEAETLLRRTRRETAKPSRAAIIAAGLLLVVTGGAVALFALFSAVSELPQGRRVAEAPESQIVRP